MHFYKYQATGNDFIIFNNRKNFFPKNNSTIIQKMCDRRFGIGADGLILLEDENEMDFRMVYYNSDGHEGSMCGNGGRSIVAFAAKLFPEKTSFKFHAWDGVHLAEISDCSQIKCKVKLQMKNSENPQKDDNDFFLDTGSPHLIRFVNQIEDFPVFETGKILRNKPKYGKKGINVNFVEVKNDCIHVRTFERGVEDETLSCGTGVTAAAIVSFYSGIVKKQKIKVHTRGGELQVSFEAKDEGFSDIYLEGDAEFVFEGEINPT